MDEESFEKIIDLITQKKKAATLLSSGDMNVSEVMYACGFSNAASFSTVFKKLYGVSPRDYMNEHQNRGADD